MFQEWVRTNKIKKIERKGIKTNLYHDHSIQYQTEETIQFHEDELLDYTKSPQYLVNVVSHTNLDDFLTVIESKEGGVLHFGGAELWNRWPRNRFQQFLETPTDLLNLSTYKKVAKTGQDFGVYFMLDVESFDYTTRDTTFGYFVGAVHPLDFETPGSYLEIQPGLRSVIAVDTKVITTTEQAKNRFLPHDRKCFYDDEIELDHFPNDQFRYSITNCLAEAYIQAVESFCNCSSNIAPFKKSDFPRCFGSQTMCERSHFPIGKYQTILSKGQNFTCQASCEDQTFTATLSSTKISTRNSFRFGDGYLFCFVLKKLIQSCQSIKSFALNETYNGMCERVGNLESNFTCHGGIDISYKISQDVERYSSEQK